MFLIVGFASPSLLRPEPSGVVSFWYLDSEGVSCLISGGENPVVDNSVRGENSLRVLPFPGPCQARLRATVCPHRCLCQWGDSTSSSQPSSASSFLAALTLRTLTPKVSAIHDALHVPRDVHSPARM